MAKAAQLDFTNVKDGGGFNKKHQAEGDYRGKILKVADVTKKDDKAVKMWLWTIKVGPGTYPYYTTHSGPGAENQLWKIRNLFVAAGKNVPKKRVAVNPDSIVGRDIAVTLEDEEYDGKLQSVIGATFPVAELEGTEDGEGTDDADGDEEDEDEETPNTSDDEDEEEEEEPAPKPKKKKAKEPEAEAETPKKKKKKAAAAVADDELEELDIEDI